MNLQKARELAEGAISLQTEDIKVVAQDDIVFLAERLLKLQEDFQGENIPHHVDIAYHHTIRENLGTIRTTGLLSRSERNEKQIVTRCNGAALGDGVYCSVNPMAYAHFGDVTIIIARMKGKERVIFRHNPLEPVSLDSDSNHNGINSVEVTFPMKTSVLKSGSQCIPLFCFDSSKLQRIYQQIAEFHKTVQHRLLDRIFNGNMITPFDHTDFILNMTFRPNPRKRTSEALLPKLTAIRMAQSFRNHPVLVDLTDKLDERNCYARNEDSRFPWYNLLTDDLRCGCKSGSDEEIILHFEFRDMVKIRSMRLTEYDNGSKPEQNPSRILCFQNQNNLGFDDIESVCPTQTISLTRNDLKEDNAKYVVLKDFKHRLTKSITLFVEENNGGCITSLGRLKFYGE